MIRPLGSTRRTAGGTSADGDGSALTERTEPVRRSAMPSSQPPAASADKAPTDDGFSLLEMLVTLTILSIAVTIGARSVTGMRSGRQPAHLAELIAAEIGQLRAEALRSGQIERLTFEPEAVRFLSSRAGAAPIAASAVRVTVETPPAARAVRGEIRFLPDGSATGGRIVLAGAAASAILNVEALTGRVRREEAR